MREKYSNKIKILFCIESLARGGTEKQLMLLLDKLDREKFEPHLCCLKQTGIDSGQITESNELFNRMNCKKIQLDYTSFKCIKAYTELFKLISYIKKNDIKIIQTFFQDPTIFGVTAGRLSGVRHIIACFRDMGFWYRGITDQKMRFIYHLCSGYIANSKAVRNKFVSLFGLSANKFDVIYNGIDVVNFRDVFDRKKVKSKNIIVGIVANLNRRVKRVDVFLKAAAYVRDHNQDIRFVVIGDGGFKEELVLLSKKLRIYDYVDFTGRIDDVRQWLSKIDIGVISSDSEGFSNSILEYMASGIPVVATKVGGNIELVENGKDGFLVPCEDHVSLGEGIIKLANDKKLYSKIQKKALVKIRDSFTLELYIKNYEDYYERLLLGR